MSKARPRQESSPAPGATVFLAFSPYQVLLSYCLALRDKGTANHLFVGRSGQNTELLAERLASWPGSPFREVRFLDGVFRISSRTQARLIIKRNVNEISRFMTRHEVGQVVVFNVIQTESQAVLHFARAGNPPARCVCAEDGMEAYSGRVLPKRSWLAVLAAKLFFGNWWRDVRYYGDHDAIDEFRVTSPDLVRKAVRTKPVTTIDYEPLRRLGGEAWLNAYVREMGVERSTISAVGGIFILPLTTVLTAEKQQNLDRALHSLQEAAERRGLCIAVKHHPREPEEDPFSIAHRPCLELLPRAIPVEILFLMAGRSIRFVLGASSTALFSAKWLLNDVDVFSLEGISPQANDELATALAGAGIMPLTNAGIAEAFGPERG